VGKKGEGEGGDITILIAWASLPSKYIITLPTIFKCIIPKAQSCITAISTFVSGLTNFLNGIITYKSIQAPHKRGNTTPATAMR
jgi:hypothetical protein